MFGLCRLHGIHVPPGTTITKEQLRQILAIMTGRNSSDIDVFDRPEWAVILDLETEKQLERYRRQGSDVESKSDFREEFEVEYLSNCEYQETYEERLERWNDYFIEEPLMRWLDVGEEEALIGDLLYERLLEEVHIFQDFQEVGKDGKQIKVLGDKSEYNTRAFWRNTRGDLW